MCEHFSKIRSKAVELYRIEGTDGYKNKAEEFIDRNFLPDVKLTSIPQKPPSGQSPPAKIQDIVRTEKTEAQKEIEKITSLRPLIGCSSFTNAMEAAGNKVAEELLSSTARSKAAVESIVDSFYTKNREMTANAIFQATKADLADLTRAYVKDGNKRGEILDGYENLNYFGCKNPMKMHTKRIKVGT